jgi:AraC family transcriptional regulator of adaptative response/methylated-DNA-[protein]-cysteine methyltransferase
VSESVTSAIYAAGFNSNTRFYASSLKMLGMTPTEYRRAGRGVEVKFAVGSCFLGNVLVAASERGVCAIFLGDDPESLLRELQDRFSRAELLPGDGRFNTWVSQVVGFIDGSLAELKLPFDVQGTVFQKRVWQALTEIPVGSTASYLEIAERLGDPKSARAVAGACAANPLAVAIPCHRVVRTDGSLSGYRWGVERKRALLEREGFAATCP